MVVIMAEATGATNELPKHDITKRVAAPPVRISALNLLGLLPALLLDTEREAPRVRVVVGEDENTGVVQ
jgi:hypothetical protein